MTKILQIIPTPPNSSDGIGDYALLLATQLLKDAQISTQFLVFRTDMEVAPMLDGFLGMRLSAHHSAAFLAALPEDINAIILHFSGYPYFNTSLKGMFGVETPFWLVEALETAIRSRRIKLIVMFHELPKLYWKQLYFFDYLNPVQSLVSRRIAQIADSVFTSSTKYQKILTSWIKKPACRLSIFSNMGEPETVPLLTQRKRRLVVFGGSARQRVYKNALKELIQSCHALGIEEICDIGPSLNLPAIYDFDGIKLIEMGFQTKVATSQILLTSVAGCLDYSPFPGDLSKSGVLAAYCVHGMVPILTQYNSSENDGLYRDRQYLILNSNLTNKDLRELQKVADSAREWYQTHNLQEITKVFVSCIAERFRDDSDLGLCSNSF